MARIRSIKPEFWTDGKVRRLSDSSALFFIAVWNHCDDAGYFSADSLELSMKTARWRSQNIKKMLSVLHGAGLVRLSRGCGVGMVASWRHQRIDKPRPSEWEKQTIQWDEPEGSKSDPGSIHARIGEERSRKGKDRRDLSCAPESPAASAPKNYPPVVVQPEGPSQQSLIAKYCELFKIKYGSNPVIRNEEIGVVRSLAQRPGVARCIELLPAFFQMPVPRHPLYQFSQQISAVAVKHDTGAVIPAYPSKAAQAMDHAKDQLRRIQEGKL